MGKVATGLGKRFAMVKLQEILSVPTGNASSYADLCPWYANVGDRLVLTVDGMLLAGFQFEGTDVDGKTDDYINLQIEMLEKCLNTLDEKTTLFSYIDRRFGFNRKPSTFNNWYAETCHGQLRKKQKNDYSTFRHTFFIGYKQPTLASSLVSKTIAYTDENTNILVAAVQAATDVWSGRGTVASIKRQFGELFENFEVMLSNLITMVGNVVKIRRLIGEDLNGELHKRANPASIAGPIKVPKNNWYLPSRMTSDTMVRDGRTIKFIGATMDKYVNVLSIVEEPDEVSSIHIDALLDVEAEYTLCQVFQVIETEKAKKLIQSHEMYYQSEVKDVFTRIAERFTNQEIKKENHGNQVLADEAQDALIDITVKNKKYGFHSSRLLVYGNDKENLRKDTGKVASMLRVKGYSLTPETTGLFGAFLSTLPGNTVVNPRKYLSSVEKIADLMPMRGKHEGNAIHKLFSEKLGREVACHMSFETYSNVPFQFNFHVGDVGHAIIVGTTGSGKTTFVNLALTEHQKYTPCRTYIFDKDYSMSVPTLLMGGKHLDGSTPGALNSNPLKRFLKDGDLHNANYWLRILIESSGENLTGAEKEVLSNALLKTQASGEDSWNLTMFYTMVRGVDPLLAKRLRPYVDISEDSGLSGKGLFSGYFDADDDVYGISDIMCFECTKIIKSQEISPAFLFYVTYCIEKSLDGSTPTIIYIEECWHYFKNLSFAEIFEDWARTLRKKLAFLVFATQGAKEFDEIPCGDMIVNLCPTKIFAPLVSEMTAKERIRFQEVFGVNDDEFQMIENAIPKRDYIIKQPDITKVVISKMPELTLASNDACAVEKAREAAFEMVRDGTINWSRKYIKEVLNVQI
ncbi:hypothetical protein V8Z74_15020 [Comamonas sp. w2-DMI]|uniref:VirB4 family type IV secretion system protein n=1 Tax=Comamonas sp. w2-DMI TaxID=3126391 RepID=UPI0032E52E7C